MITISDTAQTYFGHLLSQQDEDGLALRIEVQNAGTPRAACDLNFCPQGHSRDDDLVVPFEGFRLFVAAASESWLEDAEIDFEEDATGGQLTIRAPGIKGSEPAADAPLNERVEWLIAQTINPQLASHGGSVALVEITQEKAAVLEFAGGCQGCGMAGVTLKQGIEQTLRTELPEITAVVDVTDHRAGQNPYYSAESKGQSAL